MKTPQEHIATVRDQIERLVAAMNDAQADGIRIDFQLGTENATGKHVLMAFKAWQEIKTSN